MTVSEIVTKAKLSMRIVHNRLDVTLADDVKAGALDADARGVSVYTLVQNTPVIRDDDLIVRMLILYCQGEEDYNGKGQQYTKKYEELRDALSLIEEYKKSDEE